MDATVFIIFTTSGCSTSKLMTERFIHSTQYETSKENVKFGTLRGLCEVQMVSLNDSSGRELARSYKVTDAPTIVCPKTWNKDNMLKGLKSEYVIRTWIRKQLRIINDKKD